MNYGEEIGYWYLRLNGFFPISNFVIHRSAGVRDPSDCDLLAIRLPFVYEEIGGKPEDWDNELLERLDINHIVGLICEVKTGDYGLEDIFRPEYVQYSIGQLGMIPMEIIPGFSERFIESAYLDTDMNYRICKLLIAKHQKASPSFFYKSLDSANDFIDKRIQKYSEDKFADRMYFGSELMQYKIYINNLGREYQKASPIHPKPGSS
jgi:hypothetical protein